MQEIVSIYNNSIHTSTGLKPSEMSFLACRVVRMATIAFTFGMMSKSERMKPFN